MRSPIVLPGDVYEALHFSALAFGGIGGGHLTDGIGVPYCAYGHADACEPEQSGHGEAWLALRNAGVNARKHNDAAVVAINYRKGAPAYDRVTFEEWCAELNVVPDYSR